MDNILKDVDLYHIISAGAILFITFIVAKYTNKIFKHSKFESTLHIKFLKNLVIAIEWIIGTMSALYRFDGLQHLVNTLLASSGIAALVIGLAAQESFSNFFSGIMICIFKPFNIGDRISVDDSKTAGYVDDITLRHTVIRTYTNEVIIIPNSKIGSSKIENSTMREGASYPIEIDIAYENKEKRYRAIEIMEEVVKEHPMFYKQKESATRALCVSYGESGIHLKILMWTADVKDNMQACSECRMQILDRFEAEGIEIPYNKLQIVK